MKKAIFMILIFIILANKNIVFASDTNVIDTEEIIQEQEEELRNNGFNK